MEYKEYQEYQEKMTKFLDRCTNYSKTQLISIFVIIDGGDEE